MPDEQDLNLEGPPDEPPGEPELESPSGQSDAREKEKQAVSSPPAPSSSAVFSDEQISRLATGISSGLISGLKPTPEAPAPATYQAPSGPSPAELRGKIKTLDEQIDLAVTEGKPFTALIAQRDDLRDQIFDIERVQPLRAQGSAALNSLALSGAKRDRADLFRLYEKEIMELLNPSLAQGFMLSDKIVDEACNLVAGRHQKELFAIEREAETRQKKLEAAAPLPGAVSGRVRAPQQKTPETIASRFGATADEAFKLKRAKGMDEEQFARRIGYASKAEWFAADDAAGAQPHVGLDSVWDPTNNRWVEPDQLNAYYDPARRGR